MAAKRRWLNVAVCAFIICVLAGVMFEPVRDHLTASVARNEVRVRTADSKDEHPDDAPQGRGWNSFPEKARSGPSADASVREVAHRGVAAVGVTIPRLAQC